MPLHADEETGTKAYRYKFTRPDGLSGGIVQMPTDGPEFSQALGSGFTNYYFVNDVDEVHENRGNLVAPLMIA
jgi:hypothetical protein